MGCDIHLHAEIKVNGKWEHYNHHTGIPRNYDMFAKMADVRNYDDIQPIAADRGLPDDVSVVTNLDAESWHGDMHSASWFTADEIDEFFTRATERFRNTVERWRDYEAENFGYFFGNSYGGFNRYPEDRPEGVEDIRFVFWFDN